MTHSPFYLPIEVPAMRSIWFQKFVLCYIVVNLAAGNDVMLLTTSFVLRTRKGWPGRVDLPILILSFEFRRPMVSGGLFMLATSYMLSSYRLQHLFRFGCALEIHGWMCQVQFPQPYRCLLQISHEIQQNLAYVRLSLIQDLCCGRGL